MPANIVISTDFYCLYSDNKEVARFRKDHWSIGAIITWAENLGYAVGVS